MEIKGMEKDLAKMFALTADRAERFAKAANKMDLNDSIKKLSRALHPAAMNLKVSQVKDELPGVKTYRLVPKEESLSLPVFRAGQYLSVKAVVGNVKITRPYSIASAPDRANSFYELTIRRKEGGFFTGFIWDNWKEGTVLNASGPHGTFYYDSLRDKKKIAVIAGGSGITPIKSLIYEALTEKYCSEIVLLYGSRNEKEIVYKDELDALAEKYPQLLNIVHVISEPSAAWNGRCGLIDSALILEQIGNPQRWSYFLCGPVEMHRFCLQELYKIGLPKRLIRTEVSGSIDNIAVENDFPREAIGRQVNLCYQKRNQTGTVLANSTETILVALEKAGLAPESQCRSGECGFCRSLLLSGNVYIRKDGDGRRAADFVYGFIHPCSTYPLSDLKVVIN